jgi:site-specific recombinase XerD
MPRKQKHRRTFHFEGKLLGDRTFSSKKLADAWYEEMRRKAEAVKAGLPMAADDLLVRAAAAKWISVRETTNDYFQEDNAKMIRMIPRFGEKTMKAVTKGDCEVVLHGIRKEGSGKKGAQAGKPLSGATFNRYRACLHTFFEYCIDEGIRETNPVTRIETMPELERGVHVPDDQAKAYLLHLQAKEAPVYFAFQAFGMNSGTRDGERLGLTRADYQPQLRRFEIRRRYQRALRKVKDGTKGGKGRFVPLTDYAIAALEFYLPHAPDTSPEAPLFQEPDGSLMNLNRLDDAHRRALAAAGLAETVRPYDMTRHKFASEVTQKFGLRAAQEALGHSSSALTERYSHSDPAALVNRLAKGISIGTDEKQAENDAPATNEKHGTKLGPATDLSQVSEKEGGDDSGK